MSGGYTNRIIRARRQHQCDDHRGCVIEPGELYLEAKEFPGADAGYADTAGHPVRLKLCRRTIFFQRQADERQR